jgi:hypothetical protein
MKIDKKNLLTVGLAGLISATLLAFGPKAGYVHCQLSIWLMKFSIISLAIWFCTSETNSNE